MRSGSALSVRVCFQKSWIRVAHETAGKFRRAARSSTPQPGFSVLALFRFGAMDSDPFHQNDELDKISDLP
jgi:hypothetical protein